MSSASLFQRIGGQEILQKIVAQFYQYALKDDKVSAFFLQHVSDIPKLHQSLGFFLTHIFGGENHYKGPNMMDLHKNMKISMEHFDAVWKHFQEAFIYFEVDEALIQEVKKRLYTFTGQIVHFKQI